MLSINESNYNYYKSIYSIIWECQLEFMNSDFPADASPIKILDAWEKQSMAKARKGLRESLIDTFSSVKYWPEDYLMEINRRLKIQNFPKIKLLSARIKDLPKKILAKGKIKNIQEYFIIKDLLDDNEFEIEAEDKLKLNQIFMNFEENKIRK